MRFAVRMPAGPAKLRGTGAPPDGAAAQEEDIVEVTQDTETLEEEIGTYLDRQKQLPTAFIADNDLIGIMAVKTMQARGLRVPEDISVIGFDDAGLCQLSTPKLTTVRADFEKWGKERCTGF